jgi:type IV pilus assembly protein PilX
MNISFPEKQEGFSLVVVLVLLIVTSILGIAVLRSSSMQERMSANMRDRSLAMQAAESALRFAQNEVLGAAADGWDKKIPLPEDCVAKSICPTGSAATWRAAPTIVVDGVSTTSEYWVEYLGLGPGYKGSCDTVPPSLDCQSPLFRITARSQAAGRANVSLQAVVSSRIPTPGT